MLLTHLWKKIDQPDTNISINSTNTVEDISDDYSPNLRCGCYDSSNFFYSSPIPPPCNFKYNNQSLDISNCSCYNSHPVYSKSKDNLIHKPNYFDTTTLTTPLRLTHIKANSYDDSRKPNITALRALTNVAHYNSCWTFSSMPEIPVTLLDDEFLVDTGIRIPAQLSSSQSTSKIPNLQDIIYRNTRIGNVNKSRRSSVNFDKGKSKDGHYLMVDQTKSNRLSMNYDDSQFAFKCLIDKKNCIYRGRPRMFYEKIIDDKVKRSTATQDRDKTRMSQSQGIIDRTKRHSTSYSSKPTDFRDSKHKFKRHSLEVTDYSPIERGNGRLKRNFTLDVNHNQGSSKIPLRNSVASGSRTAPVTRASSPIRMGPQLSFDRDRDDYCSERHLARFSSSDEEVDKLCIKFAYIDSSYIKEENPRKSLSKLPVWVPRKKS